MTSDEYGGGDAQFICPTCGGIFENIEGLARHCREHESHYEVEIEYSTGSGQWD